MDLSRYNDNAFLISGKTYNIRGEIKELGATWNKPLGGWVFPSKKLSDFKEFVKKNIPEDHRYKLTSNDISVLGSSDAKEQKVPLTETVNPPSLPSSLPSPTSLPQGVFDVEMLKQQIAHMESALQYMKSVLASVVSSPLTVVPPIVIPSVVVSSPVVAPDVVAPRKTSSSSREDSESESEEELMARTGSLKKLFA